MSVTSKKTQEALYTLHRAYVEKLPQEVSAITKLWSEAINEAYIDQELLRDMHLVSHSLSGSGATYGLGDVSETFACLEEVLQRICDEGEPTSEDRQYVDALLQELERKAEAEVERLAAPDAGRHDPAGSPDRPAIPPRSSHPLVLVVDDTEAVRRRLQVGLEAGGFQVVEAEDGEQALKQARLVQPDLILLDVRMPTMDGFEAQRLIRAEDALKSTPILFLTSTRSVNMEEIQTALSYGVEGYLSKTTPIAQIVEKARATLSTP